MDELLASLRIELGRPIECVPVPLCPEISLWLLSEAADLDATCAELADMEHPPYWAFSWVGGQALARYVLDHPDEVRGRTVVDFGTGSGIAAIAAALAGARSVLAVDADRSALRAAAANAARNAVQIATSHALPSDWDVLLAADVLYEGTARERLTEHLHSHFTPGRRVLISDPERADDHKLGALCGVDRVVDRIEARTYPDVDGPKRGAFIYASHAPELATNERP